MKSKLMSSGLRVLVLAVLLAAGLLARLSARRFAFAGAEAQSGSTKQTHFQDPRLKGAYRFERGGWIYVHLQGPPSQIGFQHGYLLAPEIQDFYNVVKLWDTHATHRDWNFFLQASHNMLWPKMDSEYEQEIEGIVAGLHARGVELTVDDIVAMNAIEELADYYVPWYNARHNVAYAPHLTSPGNCSAFVATGSYTKDHKIVIAHNNWTNYMNGERWRIIFDIVPSHGYRMLMDGLPGVITSDDDFGINSDGIMVTETTISQFYGWNPNGKPEFDRSRKALQYSTSIDDYVRIMLDGNNGGYANDWLLGDRKTDEIARFELGLRAYKLYRTKDGYFVGSNFASDPKVIKLDTKFDPNNPATSPNARHTRWTELMKRYKGQIDPQLAEKFLSDHMDAYLHEEGADERTLCGHGENSPRGVKIWDWPPYFPGGAVQGKVTDSDMAAHMTLIARRGHPCGEDFIASTFLKQHPQYSWMSPLLKDMKAGPWTIFRSGGR